MMRTLGRVLVGLLLVTALGAPSAARADEPAMAAPLGQLRPEWTIERPRAGRARLVGYLYNDNGVRNAHNVRLRIEQLTTAGAVGRVYRSWIVGDVLSRNRMPFDVAVTEPDGVATYRVLVESVDWFMECR